MAKASSFLPFAADEVVSGYDIVCMLSNGSMYCWGLNDSREMGNPDFTDNYERRPIKVASTSEFHNTHVSIISAGEYNNCAVEDGSAFCWGGNAYGVLGVGEVDTQPTPVKVAANDGFTNTHVTALETSDSRTCAIEYAKLYCWGSNEDGELGTGSSMDHRNLPHLVDANGAFTNTAVSAFDVGRRSICLLEHQKMFCAGWNERGQLGTGDTTNRFRFTEVAANPAEGFVNEDITLIAAGEFGTCAVRFGKAYCWGQNEYGTTGTSTVGNVTLPEEVVGNDGFTNTKVTSVQTHEFNTCFLEAASMYCTGWNDNGLIGAGDETPRAHATKALPNGDFKNQAVVGMGLGDSNVCVIEARRTFCTGDMSDDYVSPRPEYSSLMVPVFGELSPRTAVLNPGTAGFTVVDGMIYDQGLPPEVTNLTSINVLYESELATTKLVTQTPKTCLTVQDEVLFIKRGTCRLQIVAKSDGTVLFTRSTKVTKKSLSTLGVGNKAAAVKKVMFDWETKNPKNMDATEWTRIRDFLQFTDLAVVVGYTHTGSGVNTSVAFSKKRANVVSKHLRQAGLSIGVYGLGPANPIARGPSQDKQQKNERVMVYMLATNRSLI